MRWGFWAIFGLLFAHSALAQSWQSVTAPPGSGTKYLARIKNADGHSLTIKRKIGRAGYEAFAELSLGKGLKFGKEMPVFQIDSGRPEDTRIITLAGENLGQRWGYVEGNTAGWRVWTSPVMELRNEDSLAPWRMGSAVTVSFVDSAGKAHKAEFSLSGSNAAISDAVTGPFK